MEKTELINKQDDLLRKSHDALQNVLDDLARMVRQKYLLEPEKYSTYSDNIKVLNELKDYYGLEQIR